MSVYTMLYDLDVATVNSIQVFFLFAIVFDPT